MAVAAPHSAPQTVQTSIESVTPAKAERWLTRNKHNRNIKPSVVAKYAGAMRRGEWQLNGDAIRFDLFGNLLDGQHRLLAIIDSGVTVQTVVIRNLPTDAQVTMDVGKSRSPADHLRLHGYLDPNTLASALSYLHRIRTGQLKAVGQGYVAPTVDEMLGMIAEYPGLFDSITMSHRLNKRLRVPRSQMAALHAWFSTIDPEDADSFFESLTTGLNLTEGSPIYALRSWLEKTKSEKRVSRFMIHGVVVKAWNAYRDGEEMRIARFRPAIESTPEPQ